MEGCISIYCGRFTRNPQESVAVYGQPLGSVLAPNDLSLGSFYHHSMQLQDSICAHLRGPRSRAEMDTRVNGAVRTSRHARLPKLEPVRQLWPPSRQVKLNESIRETRQDTFKVFGCASPQGVIACLLDVAGFHHLRCIATRLDVRRLPRADNRAPHPCGSPPVPHIPPAKLLTDQL